MTLRVVSLRPVQGDQGRVPRGMESLISRILMSRQPHKVTTGRVRCVEHLPSLKDADDRLIYNILFLVEITAMHSEVWNICQV